MRNIFHDQDNGQVQTQTQTQQQHQIDTIIFYALTTLQRALKKKKRMAHDNHNHVVAGGNSHGHVDQGQRPSQEDLCIVPYECRVELRRLIYTYIFRTGGDRNGNGNESQSVTVNANGSANGNGNHPASRIMPPTYLRTKIGVVLALLIQVDFPHRWHDAFQELIQVANADANEHETSNENGSETGTGTGSPTTKAIIHVVRKDIFLRTLDAFCDEVVEDTTRAVVEQNTYIKDYMRGIGMAMGTDTRTGMTTGMATTAASVSVSTAIPVMDTISANIIQSIMMIFQNTIRHVYDGSDSGSTELQKLPILALSVLKRFISWIDVSLIMNENVISSLVTCLRHAGPGDDDDDIGSLASQCAAAAVECMKEIVNKGMDDEKKVQMIMWNLPLLRIIRDSGVNLTVVDGTHIHVVIKVAELVTLIGMELVSFWERMVLVPFHSHSHSQQALPLHGHGHGEQEVTQLSSQLQLLMDIFFQCFAYDDIDVSGAVVPLACRLMTTLQKEIKGHPDNPPQQHSHSLLPFRVSQQMPQMLAVMYGQMKYPPDFEFDYEDDDDAEEEMFRTELRKLNQSVTRIVPDLSLQFLGNALSQIPTPLSSAPTHEMEAALRLVYHYCEGVRPPPGTKQVLKNPMFRDVLLALHSSDVHAHPHREVLILYYDIAVRYADVLKTHEGQALLPSILESISGPRGLQHDHPRVRSRSCYLLLKLVKALVDLLRPFVETAVGGIQGLLSSNHVLSLHPDDTLYLFETIGLLLGRTGLGDDEQQRYLIAVMTPHMQRIEERLKSPDVQRDPETHGEVLAYSIASLAYLTKGFTKKISSALQAILGETIPGTLSVLQALPSVDVVRNKVMIYLQRLFICLGDKMLDVIAPFLELLILHCTQEDLLDVAQVLHQLCFKFKTKSIPIMDACLLPFLNKCHEVMPSSPPHHCHDDDDEDDDDNVAPHILTEQMNVKKIMYATLNQIVTSGCTPVLISSKNVSSLENILRTVGDGAMNVADPIMKKNAIQFFKELTHQWIVESSSSSSNSSSSSHTVGDANIVIGFQKYLMEVFLPGMFDCFLDESFNEKDAMQYRSIREVAAILSSLLSVSSSIHKDQHQHHCPSCPDMRLEQCIGVALIRRNLTYPTSYATLLSDAGAKSPSEMEAYIKSLLEHVKKPKR